MVTAIQRHNKYQANIASFTNARAAMLQVSSKSKLSVKDFLPFPDEIDSQGGVMQFRTVEVLRKLIGNHAMPPRVEMAARKALGGMLDG